MKKSFVNYAVLGALAYWGFSWWKRTREGRIAAKVQVVSAGVLPTDSMAPGTIGPAIDGVIKENGQLSCMGGCGYW